MKAPTTTWTVAKSARRDAVRRRLVPACELSLAGDWPRQAPAALSLPGRTDKSIQNAPDDINFSIVEGYVNYVMKDYFAKLALGYQHTDMGKGASGARVAGNAIQFGFQIQQ